MPEEHKPTTTPVPKIDETKPVVWTPEDASRFLTSAIHEAQRPLADALKQRPVTSKAFTTIIAILVVAAIAIALLLSSQLEKTERRADDANRVKDELMSEKATLQAKSTTLEERLTSATDQITNLRGSGEELQRTKGDLARFRRQNELLRSQISGLEMEKVALARQLEAVKAMAIDEGMQDGEAAGTAPFDGKGEEAAPETGKVVDVNANETVTTDLIKTVATEPLATAELPGITTSGGGNDTITEPVADLQPTAAFQTRPEAASVPAPEDKVAEPASEPVKEETVAPIDESSEPSEAPKEETSSADVEPAAEPAVENVPATEPEPVAVKETFDAASAAYGESLAEDDAEAATETVAEPVQEQKETSEEPATIEETPAAVSETVEEIATVTDADAEVANEKAAAVEETVEETVVEETDEEAGEETPAKTAPEGEYVTSDEVETVDGNPTL